MKHLLETTPGIIKNLFKTLSKAEQKHVLPRLMEILNPTPTPRAGITLRAIVKLLPRKEIWSVADLIIMLPALKVQTTPKRVYNALGYLTRKGFIRRVGYGEYTMSSKSYGK